MNIEEKIISNKGLYDEIAFIILQKEKNIKDIYENFYYNNWINKDNIIIYLLNNGYVKEKYNIDCNNYYVYGILYDSLNIEINKCDSFRLVFNEDIIVYSRVTRNNNNYSYELYTTSNDGIKYNFYNIEKEIEKISFKESFYVHEKKSFEGFIIDYINNTYKSYKKLLKLLIPDNKINNVNSYKECIEYIFSIGSFMNENLEYLEINDSYTNLYNEIDIFCNSLKKDLGNFISFHEIDSDKYSPFYIKNNTYCILCDKGILVISSGSYE